MATDGSGRKLLYFNAEQTVLTYHPKPKHVFKELFVVFYKVFYDMAAKQLKQYVKMKYFRSLVFQ